MAIRPSHIEDKTGRETNTHEARHARLRSLADSINDTARMARNSLALLSIVALYLGLTLISSTDENLLRNGQVVLPQVGVGISVGQSYIFAPLVFLYLHAQLLFLLTVLARKVRTFEAALKEEFPGTASPNKQREECWDWLSAFAFVQRFRLSSGVSHVSKVLVWLSVEAVPVVLLFVLDLSFVRYQSALITWEHHIIFVIDLALLTWFNWQVFGGGSQRLWAYLNEMVTRILRRPRTSLPLAERRPWEMLGRVVTTAWKAVVFGMALVLIFAAHPPSFDSKTVVEDRLSIWGSERLGFHIGFWEAVLSDGKNLLDAGPCKWWGLACRYLDVRSKGLVNSPILDMVIPKPGNPGDNRSFANITLAGRKLLFANLQGTHLQGADFTNAHLQGVNLRVAYMQGANLRDAQLQGADLRETHLQGANLTNAGLQGANLTNAHLQGAYLWLAHLQGARLVMAHLQGAYLWLAQLQGADLKDAQLQGTNLRDVHLQGADLRNAQLQCTNLRDVHLQGADLGDAQLQGADLGDEELQGSADNPDLGYLVWAPGVSYDFPADKSSYLKTLVTDETATVKLAWAAWSMSVGELLQECVNEDQEYRVFLPSNHVQPDWNAWANWTAEFACEDEYTARSSLERWTSPLFPLSGLEGSDRAEAQKLVSRALVAARETGEKCPGLHSISDDEWEEFIGG